MLHPSTPHLNRLEFGSWDIGCSIPVCSGISWCRSLSRSREKVLVHSEYLHSYIVLPGAGGVFCSVVTGRGWLLPLLPVADGPAVCWGVWDEPATGSKLRRRRFAGLSLPVLGSGWWWCSVVLVVVAWLGGPSRSLWGLLVLGLKSWSR